MRTVADGRRGLQGPPQVGGFHLDDPLLDAVWGSLEDAGTPCSCTPARAGRHRFTGPASMAPAGAVTRGSLVVAHLGAPECVEFLRSPPSTTTCHLDTTMTFNRHSTGRGSHAVPDGVAAAAAPTSSPKLVLGSDFPNIPYPYAHQLEGPARTGTQGRGRLAARRSAGTTGLRLFDVTSRRDLEHVLGCGRGRRSLHRCFQPAARPARRNLADGADLGAARRGGARRRARRRPVGRRGAAGGAVDARHDRAGLVGHQDDGRR